MLLPTILVVLITTQFTWTKFEEPINSCYTTNAGSVSTTSGVTTVVANQGGTFLSDHVIAQDQLNSTGSNGKFTAN